MGYKVDKASSAISPDFLDGTQACANQDPDLWFAPRGAIERRIAITLCQRCPLQKPCLEWALTTSQGHGVWGGLTPENRTRVRNRRAILAGAS